MPAKERIGRPGADSYKNYLNDWFSKQGQPASVSSSTSTYTYRYKADIFTDTLPPLFVKHTFILNFSGQTV